ncbi:hypothetical protein Bhyg_02786 [Pseudolycoriella hygida]|uniref:Uncharacterized protein n=1 Tax=Pseudolycoriella hygida TaxID=35572 RepID=A0A9Q0NCG5_9DIPT|nr:hypothetical protein Bhyg_02786 [Pseudolycoriella hygida]
MKRIDRELKGKIKKRKRRMAYPSSLGSLHGVIYLVAPLASFITSFIRICVHADFCSTDRGRESDSIIQTPNPHHAYSRRFESLFAEPILGLLFCVQTKISSIIQES